MTARAEIKTLWNYVKFTFSVVVGFTSDVLRRHGACETHDIIIPICSPEEYSETYTRVLQI